MCVNRTFDDLLTAYRRIGNRYAPITEDETGRAEVIWKGLSVAEQCSVVEDLRVGKGYAERIDYMLAKVKKENR